VSSVDEIVSEQEHVTSSLLAKEENSRGILHCGLEMLVIGVEFKDLADLRGRGEHRTLCNLMGESESLTYNVT